MALIRGSGCISVRTEDVDHIAYLYTKVRPDPLQPSQRPSAEVSLKFPRFFPHENS